MQGFPGVKYM